MNKPFLKWAGSKRKIVNIIKDNVGVVNGRFIEPFVGSGVVFLNIVADEYILADLNPDLINLFRTIQIEGDDFIKFTKRFFVNTNNEKSFYDYRILFNETTDLYVKSALFIYLNRHAFNGLCRYNLSNRFNVPYGRYETVYFPEEELKYFADNTKRCTFLNLDFRETVYFAGPEDVVYSDPPYAPISKTSNFNTYCGGGFNLEDQQALVAEAEKADCKFLISNNLTDFTVDLYKNADRIIELDVQKSISGKSEGRQKTKEVLVIYNKHLTEGVKK